MWISAAVVLFLAWQSNPYDVGVKALDQNRYQDAVTNFTSAIAATPADYTAHFNLALAYSLLDKNAEAAAEYKKTLELKPGLYQAQLNLGIILLRQKQPSEAKEVLAAAAAQKPQQFSPNYHLGEALLAEGDFPGAEKSFAAAAGASAKSAGAELGLARAIAKQNRLADAAPHFRKAAGIDPKFNDALLELAALYESAKQYPEAIALYSQFPNEPGAEEHLGELLLASGRTADAIQRFEAVVSQSPTPANRAALADAYLANHQPDKALPLIDQELQTEPGNYQFRMLHGRILRDQRKFPLAAADFLQATRLKSDSAEAWSELAGALVLSENYPGALAALDRLHALHAEKPGHFYLRAIILDKFHQLKPALENYQQFLSLSQGESPNEEFKARQRIRIIENELSKR